ncbi:MAG: P-loop NTPase [Dehalococcoidales bacterium]|nr:P-loop NTPase [Dehalococcoidales bacterium]
MATKKILLLAVKGGTGKSTTTVGLGKALGSKGFHIGFLDIDLSGANLPMALGMQEPLPHVPVDMIKEKMLAVKYDGFEIFSLAFRFGTAALLWGGGNRIVKAFGQEFKLDGTGRYNLVKQMIQNVEFGDLDYLLIDNPPSSGDEVLSLYDNMPDIYGCILVSQPTNLAVEDMERALDMIENKRLPLIGMVGNMVNAICPHCHQEFYPFSAPGVELEDFCRAKGVPYLISIPMTTDKTMLECRFGELAGIVLSQKPVLIWERSFKERFENAVIQGAMKAALKGIK